MKFTQLPSDAFKKIQLNAGIILSTFTPGTPTVTASNIIGATSGGCQFSCTPSYKDYGEDVDNCPKNTKELKKLESWEVKLSGNFISVDTALAKKLLGAAAVDSSDTTKVVPHVDVAASDFSDIWWVGDYSDVNEDGTGSGAAAAGFIAIKIKDALSTGGFKIQSTDKNKGQFAFEFTGHSSMNSVDTVPCEIYVKQGSAGT